MGKHRIEEAKREGQSGPARWAGKMRAMLLVALIAATPLASGMDMRPPERFSQPTERYTEQDIDRETSGRQARRLGRAMKKWRLQRRLKAADSTAEAARLQLEVAALEAGFDSVLEYRKHLADVRIAEAEARMAEAKARDMEAKAARARAGYAGDN